MMAYASIQNKKITYPSSPTFGARDSSIPLLSIEMLRCLTRETYAHPVFTTRGSEGQRPRPSTTVVFVLPTCSTISNCDRDAPTSSEHLSEHKRSGRYNSKHR